VIEHLTNKMQTRCVGRYIIDLPRELHIVGRIKINEVQITSKQKDLRSFKAMLIRREFELRETKSWDEYPFLYKEGKGESENTRYFISRERRDNDPNFRKIEAYKWDNGYAIKLEIDADDYTHPDITNDPLVIKMGIRNEVPQKLAYVLSFLKRVQGRSEDDIPTEPGVCFFGGFMKGKAEKMAESEKVDYGFAVLQNPDALFTIATDTEMWLDTTLLERSKIGVAESLLFNIKTLRKGVVNLPDFSAEELLVSTKTIKGTPGHYLALEANPKTASTEGPLVTVNLETGISNMAIKPAPKSSSLNDKEVVALWDAVTRTLRARPKGF